MAPDNLKHLDPSALPFMFGMVARAKGFVVTKGMTALVTASMMLGGALYKLEDTKTQLVAIQVNMVTMQNNMQTMQANMYLLQQEIALTRKDITHMITDMDKLTAQVGVMQSNIAKIRR